MPQVDLVRALFTYVTALVTVVGGGAFIFIARSDPSATDVIAIVSGFIGLSLSFLYGAEVQTRTARQAAASTAAQAAVAAATTAASHNGDGPTLPSPPHVDG